MSRLRWIIALAILLPGCAAPLPTYPASTTDQAALAIIAHRHDQTRTLASEERLFAYVSWPAYMGVDRTASGTLTRWDDRHAELKRLAQITDPKEFARVSANTQFGRIDVSMSIWR